MPDVVIISAVVNTTPSISGHISFCMDYLGYGKNRLNCASLSTKGTL